MELADVEAFLVLAEELHFGRTAERVYVSPARVSQRIQALEREVGGTLFERNSRRVALTPLGARLRDEIVPAYQQLTEALRAARDAARSPAGTLRVGFTPTTAGPPLDRLVAAFERDYPDSAVVLRELPIFDPLSPLRAGDVDLLANWLPIADLPDLVSGPVLDVQPRALAVGVGHPLAGRDSVSIEVIADYPMTNWQAPELLETVRHAMVPLHTPSGRPVRFHPEPVRTVSEGLSLVARGLAVHPTVASLGRALGRDDIVLIPIVDQPPLPLGLIWCAAHENARIRALAATAEGSVG